MLAGNSKEFDVAITCRPDSLLSRDSLLNLLEPQIWQFWSGAPPGRAVVVKNSLREVRRENSGKLEVRDVEEQRQAGLNVMPRAEFF